MNIKNLLQLLFKKKKKKKTQWLLYKLHLCLVPGVKCDRVVDSVMRPHFTAVVKSL